MASYILQSLGLYTIGERRGIRNSWLAWIPLGNLWLLGSISDQYQYVAKGRIKNRRKLMLGLEIALIVGCVIFFFLAIIGSILSASNGGTVVGGVLLILVGIFALGVASITLAVFQYMCYYDLFRSCQPDNAVLHLILSIVFPVILPFLVFACRKKDLGMPPRKKPATAQLSEEIPAEPVVEEGFAQPDEFEEV